jgi:ribosomal protein S1
MAEGSDVVAGIDEVSHLNQALAVTYEEVPQTPDDDQRALEKTHTNKRPKEAKKAKKPLSDLQVGTTVAGKVVSIMPHGALVDIGTATDGLVHV